MQVRLGYKKSFISLEQGYDTNLLLAPAQSANLWPTLLFTRGAGEACQTNGTREGVVRADAQVHAPQQR